MESHLWDLVVGNGPLVAAAIHDGGVVRAEVAARFALSADDRLREEDPCTGLWTAVADTRIVVNRSRFEMDLNRPRARAVYLQPEDAWGLQVWREPPPAEIVERSLRQYDLFYQLMEPLLGHLIEEHGRIVILDLHSYNHRRAGPDSAPADPQANPEVNVGTGNTDRERWGPLIERFIADLRAADQLGRPLDVRENVKFRGGHFSRWIHQTWGGSACALAIEFKKFFMDEWTGEPDREQVDAICRVLASARPGLLEELQRP